jgi:hypothetical protein
MTGETKMVFGSSTTVISHAATLANNGYTYSGLTGCTMNTLDNSSTLYPHAIAVLDIPDTFSAAPTANSVVNLWMIPQDVDGTSDVTPPPDSTAIKQAILVGQFPMVAYDVQQRVQIIIDLEGIKAATFSIENKTGVSMSYTSNPITVKVTPFTKGPAA